MDCEICGKDSTDLFLISVEGTKLKVCKGCSSCGSFIGPIREDRIERRIIVLEEPEIGLIENHAKAIQQARQKTGLSQEEFAKKINENLNVIRKVEKGELAPTEKLCRKLEREFRIKLLQPVKKEAVEKKKTDSSLSLEDVAIIKK
jgi:putative transcription factor